MAVTSTLKLRMGTLSGEKTFSFKYADRDVTSANVKALAQAMITNGEVYKYPPQVLTSATIEVLDSSNIDIS